MLCTVCIMCGKCSRKRFMLNLFLWKNRQSRILTLEYDYHKLNTRFFKNVQILIVFVSVTRFNYVLYVFSHIILTFQHPECMPIPVPFDDWFLSRFDIRCMEFVRSAPSTNIDCHLGWREQINQATSYVDGSMIYGSDTQRAEALRSFRRGNCSTLENVIKM